MVLFSSIIQYRSCRQMKIKTYLFDSKGKNKEVEFDKEICRKISNNQLLWIDILEREKETIEYVISVLMFKHVSIENLVNEFERPKLDKFEDFYRFFINSINLEKKGKITRVPIDFLVAENVVVTVHSVEAGYFEEFKNLDRGEKHIGELDAEGFVASLLDLHIVSYFRAVESIEQRVDSLDDRILRRDLKDEEFLSEMLELRRDVSKLRRWLLPHRDVFYALSRPDFARITESDSAEHYQKLNEHFEGLVNAIESARDTVLSLFDLYTTRAAHKLNNLMKRLTFVTIIFGALAVIVGAFGMNFETEIFKSGNGFWITVMGMGILSLILLAIAKIKDWI